MIDETAFNQNELRRQFNNQGKVTTDTSLCHHDEIEFLEEDQELVSDGCLVRQKFICKDCGDIARREWVIPNELEWDNHGDYRGEEEE